METAVTLAFGDGEYLFWLPLPQVLEIERKTGKSILQIEESIRTAIGQDADGNFSFVGGGSAMAIDILEVLRCGLIGGNSGMVDSEECEVGPLAAKRLIDTYAYPARPLGEGAVLAWRVLHTAIFNVELNGSKKKEAESTKGSKKAKSSQTAG